MKSKIVLLALTSTFLAFGQQNQSEICPEVHVHSITEASASESRNNKKEVNQSEFKNYIKVVGCGCETELIDIEKKDSQSKIAEELSQKFKHSCKASDIEIKEFKKVVKKKRSWFRRVFGLKARTKTKESFSVKMGDLVLEQNGKKKNKAMKKFQKCSKRVAKHLGKVEPLLSFADEKDRSVVEKFKADMNKFKVTDSQSGKESEVLELAFKKGLYSIDSDLKCKDRELKQLYKRLKKASKKK